jgi:hypothetical protein
VSPLAFRAGRPRPARRRGPLRGRGAAGCGLAGLLTALVLLAPQAHAAPGDGTGTPGPDQGYAFTEFAGSVPGTDYDHRTVTLTGRLLRYDPAGGADLPAAGAQVELTRGAPGATGPGAGSAADTEPLGTVTTDAQGRFRLTGAEIDPPAGAGTLEPSVVPVFAVYDGETSPGSADPGRIPSGPVVDGAGQALAELDLTVTPSAARLTMDYRPGPVTADGRTITAEGVVERRTDSGWAPAGGVPVSVGFHTPDGAHDVRRDQPTGADGRFSVPFTAAGTGVVSTTADWTADPFLVPTGAGGLDETVYVATTPPATSAPAATSVPPPVHRAAAPPMTLTPAASAAPPAARTTPPATTARSVPAAAPDRLAATGEGTPRASFLAGGSTLVAAGLVLAVARRRIRRAR